jgi:hypothetical protein
MLERRENTRRLAREKHSVVLYSSAGDAQARAQSCLF